MLVAYASQAMRKPPHSRQVQTQTLRGSGALLQPARSTFSTTSAGRGFVWTRHPASGSGGRPTAHRRLGSPAAPPHGRRGVRWCARREGRTPHAGSSAPRPTPPSTSATSPCWLAAVPRQPSSASPSQDRRGGCRGGSCCCDRRLRRARCAMRLAPRPRRASPSTSPTARRLSSGSRCVPCLRPTLSHGREQPPPAAPELRPPRARRDALRPAARRRQPSGSACPSSRSRRAPPP